MALSAVSEYRPSGPVSRLVQREIDCPRASERDSPTISVRAVLGWFRTRQEMTGLVNKTLYSRFAGRKCYKASVLTTQLFARTPE